ncbi:MAG: prepilin peptidase [Gammaproteobacteria bacterium]|jgi:leader peptidase (prepilin peptidase)/N-methyltransferase|nr:prepilin peptidase [Gammaproteobacteria bacterium]
MTWIELFTHSQAVYLTCIGVLGLIIGSFLNVVIWRLPLMLHREWTEQCYAYLQENIKSFPSEEDLKPADLEPFNLVTPRSQCPSCKRPIGIFENIPLLSFIFLKGKCHSCGSSISLRYPLIEVFCAILSIIIAYYFGFTWKCLASLILTWALIALTVIDIEHQLLPDDITLAMLWLGLLVNIQHLFVSINDAIIGVIAGYLFLWTIYWIFKLITHKEGMGYGDFKLLAMLGAWLGWQALPTIVLISSFVGTIVGVTLIVLKRHSRENPIPFGPFLAIAGWVSLIWGDKLSHLYFSMFGLS